ncbi:MAG TPA: hypothetical protein VGM54_25640 [Chthoniobacter sp.]|jgi:SAM-dependent methyltransferase
MGLEYNAIKFLLWAKNLGVSFNQTATLGRQGFTCKRSTLTSAFRNFGIPATEEDVDRCVWREPLAAPQADAFLKFLGANELVTVDRSAFEGATLIHDLNDPFPASLRGSFDLVIDGGTLEHIFDYPRALTHCLELLRVGGHFITFTPTSGQMGHGFYQFSPELFFRVFSAERGFALRKMILFECSKMDSNFYEVEDPAKKGGRSPSPIRPMQLAVLAQKIDDHPKVTDPPQQSDYVAIWKQAEEVKSQGDSGARPPGFIPRLRTALNPYWPRWMHEWKHIFLHYWKWQRGLAAQKTLRHFRRIPKDEIFRQR